MSTDIQSHALWYAWGQQDAGIGCNVDPIAFAQTYRRMDESLRSRPSIQDAWKAYISAAAMAAAEQVLAVRAMTAAEHATAIANIADEVRDFLAKSIDEAQP